MFQYAVIAETHTTVNWLSLVPKCRDGSDLNASLGQLWVIY